ncbi:TonB-dependent receptor [Oxalicibacterium flavum]|uniref:TonB-dependent receptor n=1 Tax=Oxalicibacterium flavum TaxID=179467 RepID=A0A8J2UL84_9BURK|nr:TonB-dependent receptor [Oxalicibacterium flavum]GGC11541.1 TonB-dependent receptor [Oxalicibacterium flavum]
MTISLALAVATGAFVSPTDGHAQSSQVSAGTTAHAIDLAAGPLGQALNTLAQQTGIQVIFSGSLTEGKQASALRGSYTAADALRALLTGSGLTATARDAKTFTVTNGPGADVESGVLPAVTVNAGLDAITENTGAYTTGVTSTATKMNLSLRETPQSISVITRQRIDDQQINSMTEVLNQVPGITMSQDGLERYSISSRGSALDTYQLDGVTTTQQSQTRNMPSTLLDMALYDHVEVVRGATGLMTGAGEPSGVVNLVRKRPVKGFQAHAQAGIGSWDFYRAEADVSGSLNQAGNVRGRLVAATQKSNSFMDWYGLDKDILYGVIEADLTDTTLLRFGVDYQKYQTSGAPGVPLIFNNGVQTNFPRSVSSGARWNTENIETYNYAFGLEQKLPNDWLLKLAANYMDADRSAVSGAYRTSGGRSYIDQATGSAQMLHYRAGADQVQKGMDVTLQGPFDLLGRKHEFAAGLNYASYDNKHIGYDAGLSTVNFYTWNNELAMPVDTGAVAEIFNIATRQRGAFAATKFNLADEVKVFVGARVSDYDYDYFYESPPDNWVQRISMRERSQITPYAALVYDLTREQSLYASYTDIFKPQSAQDRTGQVLDPIVGKNYELGWKGEFYGGRLNGSAAIYRIDRDNVAELDTGYTVPGTTNNAYRAIKGARTEGIDLELTGEIARNWNVQTSFSRSTTKNAQGIRSLTYVPSNTFRLWTTYALSGEWNNLMLGGGINWNSDSSLYFSSYGATVHQESYAVVNLLARYRFTKQLVATLNVNNLFDKTYYAGMGGSYGHYGSPRNAVLTVRYDF